MGGELAWGIFQLDAVDYPRCIPEPGDRSGNAKNATDTVTHSERPGGRKVFQVTVPNQPRNDIFVSAFYKSAP